MKKINKKMFLAIGSVSAIAAPISAVIACSSDDGANTTPTTPKDDKFTFQVAKYNAFDFDSFTKNKELFANDPVMFRGIGYTAQAQGVSFLYNLARELGWDWNTTGFKADYFTTNKPDIKTAAKTLYKDEDVSQDVSTIINAINSEKLGIVNQMKEALGTNPKSYVWNNLKIVNASKDNKSFDTKNADPSTQKNIVLKDFKNKSALDKNIAILKSLDELNMFGGKNYVYDMRGMVLEKVAIQILPVTQDGNDYTMTAWHYTDNFNNLLSGVNSQKKADTNIAALPTSVETLADNIKDELQKLSITNNSKKLLGNTWLDPLGIGGTMGSGPFNTFALSLGAKENIYKKYDGGGEYILENDKSLSIYKYSTFIDGRKPGTLVWKMFGDITYAFFGLSYSLTGAPIALPTITSPDNLYQTFYTVKNKDKINELSEMMWNLLNNVKKGISTLSSSDASQLKSYASPVFNSLKNWISSSSFTQEDVMDAFSKINNGSHYMLAVEIFARGLSNIPKALMPDGSQSQANDTKKIAGLANSTKLKQTVLGFAYGPSKNKGEYNGVTATADNFPFNPRLPKIYDKASYKYSNQELLKLDGNINNEIKHGTEMPVFGGKIK